MAKTLDCNPAMIGYWNWRICIAASISVPFNQPSLLVSSCRSVTLRFSNNLTLSAGTYTSRLYLTSRDKDSFISVSSSRRSSGSGGSEVPWCSGSCSICFVLGFGGVPDLAPCVVPANSLFRNFFHWFRNIDFIFNAFNITWASPFSARFKFLCRSGIFPHHSNILSTVVTGSVFYVHFQCHANGHYVNTFLLNGTQTKGFWMLFYYVDIPSIYYSKDWQSCGKWYVVVVCNFSCANEFGWVAHICTYIWQCYPAAISLRPSVDVASTPQVSSWCMIL